VKGIIATDIFTEPGMMGGYRVTRGLEMIWAILACLGIDDQVVLSRIWGICANLINKSPTALADTRML